MATQQGASAAVSAMRASVCTWASRYTASRTWHAHTSDRTATTSTPVLHSLFILRPAAFGGQFAFLELLTSMRTPSQFTGSVVACTAIMTAMYGSLGAVGYGSKGSSMHGIAVFNMTPGRAAQIAAAFIFIQVGVLDARCQDMLVMRRAGL